MAHELVLPLLSAIADDASPPGFKIEANRAKLLFSGTAVESCYFTFRIPDNYVGTPELKLQYAMASATSGDVVMAAAVAAVTPGDATNIDAKTYATANSTTQTVPATTAGKVKEISISLTLNDSLTSGDLITIKLSRLGTDGGDTASGDLELLAATLKFV